MESDCPWAAWVREFERQPGTADAPPETIRVSLDRDQPDSALRDAWGLSQNFDAGARAEIVPLPVLEALASRFGVAIQSRKERTIVHAGLIHTYGYLLSNLKTPFGYKRARWVSGRLEKGLGLPKDTLSPGAYLLGGETTLLSQVTYLLMRAATLDRPKEWDQWKGRLEARTTPALRELEPTRISQNIETQTLASGERVDWVTDFVALPKDPAGGKLLVYSQRTRSGTRLITGFPVERDFVERGNQPVKPRYNAWVD